MYLFITHPFDQREHKQEYGRGITKVVFKKLVEALTTTEEDVWKQDSRGLHVLDADQVINFPANLGGSSATLQASPIRRARCYAAGVSLLLEIYHAQLDSCISPVLAIALLPDNMRTEAANPSFLETIFRQNHERKFLKLLKESSPALPMERDLHPSMEMAGFPVRILILPSVDPH